MTNITESPPSLPVPDTCVPLLLSEPSLSSPQTFADPSRGMLADDDPVT